MPRMDGTGPLNEGPLTGRGQGDCIVDLDEADVGKRGRGLGRGLGLRRGAGRGLGLRAGAGRGLARGLGRGVGRGLGLGRGGRGRGFGGTR